MAKLLARMQLEYDSRERAEKLRLLSKVLHKLDVSNIRLSNVCKYAYKHIEGMKKPEKEG